MLDGRKNHDLVEKLPMKLLRGREFGLEKKIAEKKLHDILLQMEKPESLALYGSKSS